MKSMGYILTLLAFLGYLLTGCQRSTTEVWDDTKTASRHVGRGLRSLGGKHGNSRQVSSREEFCWVDEQGRQRIGGPKDYVPLPDEDLADEIAMAEYATSLPYDEPGAEGSIIPGVESFQSPTQTPEMCRIFANIQFPYNSSLVKGEGNLRTAKNIAEYLKNHPRIYLFVEGHCDERGPEAYNLSLGARRSNVVRDLLIKEGSDPTKIFTISYGKERPLVRGHNEEAWTMNRRAEFKIYQR